MLSPRIGVITWLRGWLPSLESLPQCVVASVSYPLSTLGWVLMGLEPEFFPAFFTRLSSWEMCWLYLSLAFPAHFPGTSTTTQVAISSRRQKLAKAEHCRSSLKLYAAPNIPRGVNAAFSSLMWYMKVAESCSGDREDKLEFLEQEEGHTATMFSTVY